MPWVGAWPVHMVIIGGNIFNYDYFRCAGIVSRFLDLDVENGNVIGFLNDYVLTVAKDVL